MDEPAIELSGISKSFTGVPVLRDVSFRVHAGSLHALLGGNGSGKSTTLKILAGVHHADPGGAIRVHGRRYDTRGYSPAMARAAGLRFVHQELGLVPDLTVSENFALDGGFPRRYGSAVAWRALHRSTQEQLDRAQVPVDARTPVRKLRPSDRTLVAIARALRDNDRGRHITLVLDEPTASLPQHEVGVLLRALRDCRDSGQTIIYVSHRLTEVLEIADQISVLRDGAVTVDIPASRASRADLIEAMTGAPIAPSARRGPEQANAVGPAVLQVQGLSAGALRCADLQLAAGEVVGLAGLVGSGRTSLLRALFGDLPVRAGTVMLDGQVVTIRTPADAIELGIALVPEDRADDAAFLDRPLWENVTAASTNDYWSGWRMDRGRERSDAAALLDRYDVRAPSADTPFAAVSGGNQQKAVLARWFHRSPRLLLLDEPTQGVDAAARADIHRFVRAQVTGGSAVLVASSDAEELAELCDRVVILREGCTSAVLSGPELTEARIFQLVQEDWSELDAPEK
ncbi:sugar ABC transporter ATP-binding protein [Streptomyces chartreusis]|uniref:Sugar ABC transporter ATP-binding protein n=2 Tax=Streptomyces chartreusis TaxID=1969 RepID=A0A7H8TC72_STRCX|nr:sugar ABC transporter ATP-binding protein [Streptomyces chartreusis]QKZ21076.1 sugar ABC transporter ATP-binding protein [Streptomyces chartreusis]